MTHNIVVKRMGALGDVILTTPVIRELKRRHPSANIYVMTGQPQVFRDNPHVKATFGMGPVSMPHDLIDLDLAYEKRPGMHIVDAYMQEARITSDHMCQELFFNQRPLFNESKIPRIAIHAAKAGWTNRTLPRSFWREICLRLQNEMNATCILVGSDRDDIPGLYATRCFIPDIQVQAGLINACDIFVGSDSGLLHAAGATTTPIVGLFTCATPEYRMPRRQGDIAVVPDIDCIGCLHRRISPVTTESCDRGDNACVNLFDSESVIDSITMVLQSNLEV